MNRLAANLVRTRGFSFTEVLFAVVILGIGFIMVAAIFPVAIQQSKLTMDETTGASLARGAVSYLERAMSDTANGAGNSNCPALEETAPADPRPRFPIVQQLSYAAPTVQTSLLTAVRGNQILPEDPRYAFVALYSRGGAAATPKPAAQIFLFALQSTVSSIYDPTKDAKTPTVSAPENNLMAHDVDVAIAHKVSSLGDVDLIAFNTGCTGANAALKNYNAAGNNGTGAPVEGGYVVIAQDTLTGNDQGKLNGHVFKLGARRSDLDSDFRTYFPAASYSTLTACKIFEIDPSNNFIIDSGDDGIVKQYATPSNVPLRDDIVGLGNTGQLSEDLPQSSSVSTLASVQMTPVGTDTARAFVVGRSYTDPNAPNGGFDGGCMVVGFYTTFVKIK